ncbi:AAA family ATPase [Micavibrio aeruginosavorus]|uniref:AAA family ATPase n=1 Tax=Micavibrio aeruginosavorus TaxID=349221 RepID=UPI003F4AF014
MEKHGEKHGFMIAIGGLSGSGKSTLAGRLAAETGAVWLRSDSIRKELWGVDPLTKLPPAAYSRDFSTKTYETLASRMEAALRAGQVVIVDMSFAKPIERQSFADRAAACGAGFHGIWLDAAPDTLKTRVDARVGDVSDADSTIVAMQLGFDLGDIEWSRINTDRPADSVYRLACALLGVDGPTPIRAIKLEP